MVGHHLFWTEGGPDGPRHGPYLDAFGFPLLVRGDGDVPIDLPAGDWILVPVDDQGRTVRNVPLVNFHIWPDERPEDPPSPEAAPVELARDVVCELAAEPARCTEALILAAVARGDHEEALARTIARAVAGLPVPIALAVTVLCGSTQPTHVLGLIAIASGDRVPALLGLLEGRHFAFTSSGDECVLAVIYAIWRLDPAGTSRLVLIRHLRSYARTHGTTVSAGIVALLAAEADDEILSRLAARDVDAAALDRPRLIRALEDALAATPIAFVRFLPSEPPPPDALDPARVTATDLRWLSLSQLARLDRQAVPEAVLNGLADRFRDAARYDLAGAVVDEAARRGCWSGEELDGCRAMLAAEGVRDGHLAVARIELAKVGAADRGHAARAGLALRLNAASALADLEAFATTAVRDATGAEACQVASMILAVSPALGILIARGAVSPAQEVEARRLLIRIGRARDRLDLPSQDDAHARYQALLDGDQLAPTVAERARLDAERAALADDLTQLRDDLDRTQAAEQRRRQLDAEERRDRLAKIAELKAIIATGNDERAALRRELEDARRGAEPAPAMPAPRADAAPRADEDESDDLVELPAGHVRIPRFEAPAAKAVRALPAHVAAEAIRSVGQLGAGDPGPWRAVKQAKALAPPLLMARIGIHHRLLFRIDEGALTVVEVVPRASLMSTLKRLRSRATRRA